MKHLLLSVLFTALCTFGLSQTYLEALRFTHHLPGATARGISTGNSMGALGGDMGALMTNPAGLGVYRASEFSFTIGPDISYANSTFVGNNTSELQTKFVATHGGGVFARTMDEGKIKAFNFAVSYNRLADYNQRFYYEGESPSSISYHYALLANGFRPQDLNPFGEGLAFNTFLIDTIAGTNGSLYQAAIDNVENAVISKSQLVQTDGAMNEIALSMAGNFDHKLYFGLSIGIVLYNYGETKFYREIDQNNAHPAFAEMELTETLDSEGSGINARVGVIYKPTKAMRIGASVQSPTNLGIQDRFVNSMRSVVSGQGGPVNAYFQETEEGLFNYTVQTSWKTTVNFAHFIKKSGFVSAELDWSPYNKAKYSVDLDANPLDGPFIDALNDQIQSRYSSVIGVRVGGEYARGKLRARGGIGYYTSPYVASENVKGDTKQMNLGIGFRGDRYFADVGYRMSLSSKSFQPFLTETQALVDVEVDQADHLLAITLGYRF